MSIVKGYEKHEQFERLNQFFYLIYLHRLDRL